ncbi:copper homeostasis protein CutC [Ulvibacter antarcticus]|uniref:PF03932 family protein CutC n=1 Tax=Ulvibacter antarcticus TaxID=442714 RepID=A0A3L9YZQ3_9FLAO|nr:copper homeostasis protein CutC [Ulvibacter antarcticus]RMA66106.1 copper homeostasis protein [Ulvibacter antarcticus]
MKIEICANSFTSAKAAQDAGADRIELCTELSVGGLTPSYGLIEKVMSELCIPVHVLIRPRSGNFTYSEDEIEVMLRDISFCGKMGCAGVVCGALTSENEVDEVTVKRFLDASAEMELTFHRAFDWCRDPFESLQILQKLGVNRILSSGQQPKAIEGIVLLKQLLNLSEATIAIMPGSGINLQNILEFKEAGFTSVHFSATLKKQLLTNPPKVSMHSSAFFEEGVLMESNAELIREIIKKVR